jgi:hypothetical protein
LQQPHSGTTDAVGGRPHHHAAASRLIANDEEHLSSPHNRWW